MLTLVLLFGVINGVFCKLPELVPHLPELVHQLPELPKDPQLAAFILDPVKETVKHFVADHPPAATPGIWRKKTIWKPRFLKEWRPSKTYKPVWRKIWGPIEIHEWIPIPKPPPPKEEESTLLHPIKSVELHSTSPIWKLQHPDTVTWPYLKPVEIEHEEEIELHSTEDSLDYDYQPEQTSNTTAYHIHSENAETRKPTKVLDDMSKLLMPPPRPVFSQSTPKYKVEEIYFTNLETSTESSKFVSSTDNEVSPLATKLAKAIILDKIQSSTKKPLALTEVRFVKDVATVAPAAPVADVGRVSVTSRTTEKPKVFIVTPIPKQNI